MFSWPEEMQMYREAVRRFVETEVAPVREELELGSLPPYEILRKFYATFGLADEARDRFERRAAKAEGREVPEPDGGAERAGAAAALIPVVEFSRHSPGIIAALAVSTTLAGGAILRTGTLEQQRRWALDLLTLEKVGAWAITEPDSGSDAFGSMRASARIDGEEYVLNGSKTFITNGPYADTIVFICKLDDGSPLRERPVLTFVLDRGTPGLEQSPPLKKMGLGSSPTGELFLDDVRVRRDRLLETKDRSAGGRSDAKRTFSTERASVTAMALGIVERCRELSIEYAKTREQFGRPIGEFQLIQQKIAKMEVARLNIENLVFRYCAMADAGVRPTLAEASAMKLYAAQAAMEVALEAVQVFGGNGYMSEYPVEQLCRDAKVLQIYGGTDELQVTSIARELLA